MQPIRQDHADVLIAVKAVPGASRDEVAGTVGDRIKVRTSAAAEGGKANAAICRLLAAKLGVKARSVTVEQGKTNPEKLVRISGVTVDAVRRALADHL